MKKKVLLLLTIIGVLLFVWFFTSNNTVPTPAVTPTTEDTVVALSTFTIIADMVREVGGDKVESISLTKPGAEIHGYQPTPSDLVRAAQADIMFENGMNLELWTEKLRAGIPNVPVVTVSTGIEIVTIAEDAYAGKPNPHAWMSPKQGLVYVENIKNALTELRPEHAAIFSANAAAYSAKIRAIDSILENSLATLPEHNRALITCEGAFSYLTHDYNLDEHYLWAINSDAQGSPQQIAKIIEVVKKDDIPAVFCESTVEPRIQNEVIAATGARFGGTLYVDSLSPSDGPAATYLTLLQHTADTIISGLTNK